MRSYPSPLPPSDHTMLGLFLTALAAPALAHGGNFRAPPAPPAPAPAPAGPNQPGPASPGAANPAGLPVAGPSTPSSGPAGGTGRGGLHWSHWWNLERDAYLELRARVRASRPHAPGRSAGLDARGVPPSRAEVEEGVLPVLLEVLGNERADDMVTAALVAAARIGADGDATLARKLVIALRGHLPARSQEVTETAALALGILGDTAALSPLLDVARGTEAGARLVQRGSVPARTRAFACFALGLLAWEVDDVATRQRIALALVEVLEESHAADDIPVAATIALGLCPAPERLTVPPEDLRTRPRASTVLSRSNQITWLMARLDPEGASAPSASVAFRAHGYASAARLAGGADRATRTRVLEALTACAGRTSEPTRVRAGALIGIGRLARSGPDGADEDARRVLEKTLRGGQPIERQFAAVALAQASSRAGGGDDGFDGAAPAQRLLSKLLTRGHSADQPWIALALGVQAHALRMLDVEDADAASRALMSELRRQRNASDVGAYAVACALTCEESDDALRSAAGEAVHDALGRIDDPTARGDIALALGLLRHGAARDDLRKIASSAKFQPGLLWSASVGLGLLGDDAVTPNLVTALATARSSASRAAAASALGHVGDRRAIAPLLALLRDEGQPDSTRAFAVVGLGVICDEHPLPWRVPIAESLPYFALTSTLVGNAKGVLDIL